MNNDPVTCDPQRIELFLQQKLNDEEQTAFELHLDDCNDCRRRLEAAAAGADVWSGVRDSLRGQQLPPGSMQPGDSALDSSAGDEASSSQTTVLELLAPTDDDRSIGRLGTYEVVAVVGTGGMGVVLKAFDAALNRYVAIKVLAPHLGSSGAARKRFSREAQAAAAVVHENVIEIHGVADAAGLPYLVMPYVRGPSLQRRLDGDGPLALVEILRVAVQSASGLAAAHAQGLVHRDVKPANILLADGVERVKLTDFGLARAADDASLTKTGIIAGTPQYMSPEQARGESIDQRSDLFSLGSVLYAMCTGRAPFRAETSYGVLRRITDDEPRPIREINPDIPEWLCRIVAKLMSKRPGDRFPSAREVAGLLQECLAHVQQPTVVPLPAVLPPLARHRAWRPPVIRLKGVVAMIAGLGISLLGMFLLSGPTTDIAGRWSGEEWGQVVLKKTNAAEYTGTYSDTDTKHPGEFQLRWSRVERQFTGTWREGDDRFGDISVSPVGNELHVAYGADAKCKDHPGTPRMKGMTWTRATAAVASDQASSSESAAPQQVVMTVKKAVTTISTCAEGDRRVAEAMASLKGLNPTDVVAELAKLLDSPEAAIRRAAAFVLWQGAFAPIEPAVPGLTRLCESADDLTRGMAARALGGNRVASSLVVLMKMTRDDRSGYARSCAAIALGSFGNPAPAVTRVLERALDDPDKSVRANAQAALTMLRGTATGNAASRMIFSPRIEGATVHGNKVVIQGIAPAETRISIYAGDRNNGWICKFPKAARFTATLELGSQGLNCRVGPEFGSPLLTIDSAKRIGKVVLSEGQLVFHSIPIYSYETVTIGEWTAKSGAKTSLGVSLYLPMEWGETGEDGLRIRLLVPSEIGQGPRLTPEDFKAVLEVWNTGNRPVRLAEQYTTSAVEMVADDWLIGLGIRVIGENDCARRFVRADFAGNGSGMSNYSGLVRTIGARQRSDFKINLRRLIDKQEGTNLLALRGAYQLVPVLELMPLTGGLEDGLWRGRVEGKPVPVQIEARAPIHADSQVATVVLPVGQQAGAPQGPLAAKMREILKQPTQIEFVETPTLDVVEYLTELHHLPFTVSENVEKLAVTLNVRGASLAAALQAIEDKYPSLQFVVLDWGIFLMEREAAKRHGFYSAVKFGSRVSGGSTYRPPNEPNRLMARKIREVLKQPTRFEFVETPTLDVVEYLTDLHHLPFTASTKVEKMPLTLNLK